MASSSTSDSTLPLNTIIHMLTIKLSSSNYLLWKNQMVPILSYQNLLHHVDGSSAAPVPTIVQGDKSVDNPALASWLAADQRTVIILHASLSEEAVTVIVGLTTARQIWVALEAAYSNSSVERVHNLRDQLRLLVKGDKTVAEFGRNFKLLCDQLAAIGHPIDANDQLHWFLCGLGPSFETFSTSVRSTRPPPSFSDLLARAESHELFIRALHGTVAPSVAFTANSSQSRPNFRGRGGRHNRGNGNNGGRGRGRRTLQCQLCQRAGHYANSCPDLASFATKTLNPTDDGLARAFHAQCHVTSAGPDWYVDSGATDHMTASSNSVSNPTPSTGSQSVTFGDGPTNKSSSSPGNS